MKTTAEVFAPSEGKLTQINQKVQEEPSLINEEPTKSWIFELSCNAEPTEAFSQE